MGAEWAVRITVAIACTGLTIELLELLARPRFLSDAGPVPWNIIRLQHRWTATGLSSRILDGIFRESARGLLIPGASLTAALAVTALAPSGFPLVQAGTAAVALTLVILALRTVYGLDGAYHMWLVIFVTVALTAAVPGPIDARLAACLIGGQAALAYFIAGASKCVSAEWRKGTALPGILSTRSYGHRSAYRLIRDRRAASTILCWSVILFEMGFPVAVFIGGNVLIAFLVLVGSFHLSTALIMGLNGFLFAFLATFPCVWILSTSLKAGLG